MERCMPVQKFLTPATLQQPPPIYVTDSEDTAEPTPEETQPAPPPSDPAPQKLTMTPEELSRDIATTVHTEE